WPARARAGVRHLPRPPAARAGARPGDLQAAVRPPRRQPSGARARERARARHLAEPRLRGRAERGSRGDARLAVRRHGRGPDYAGCQALKVLRADGFRTVVVNSNPATIMTDPGFADRTYLEPLDLEGVTEVLRKERPDALLPTMGGQTALNLARELAESGVLAELDVELIGARLDVIKRAEDRALFKDAVESC